MSRVVPEVEIHHAILELMTDRKVWTNEDLKKRLRHIVARTDKDLSASPSRKGGWKWKNRVNNALSQSRPVSLYGNKHVRNVEHGEHITTDLGYAFITGGLADKIIKTLRIVK